MLSLIGLLLFSQAFKAQEKEKKEEEKKFCVQNIQFLKIKISQFLHISLLFCDVPSPG